MPLHVCIKCVSFEEYKVALVATKLFFCFICLALFIQLHHESNSVFRQDKEMLSLHVSIQLKICLIWLIWNCNCRSPAVCFVWRSLWSFRKSVRRWPQKSDAWQDGKNEFMFLNFCKMKSTAFQPCILLGGFI